MKGIFLITAVLSILCIPLVRFGINNNAIAEPSGDALPKTNLLTSLFKHQHLWRLNWSVLVVHLLITCFFVQIPVMLVNIDVPLSEHYVLYSVVLFASVFGLVGMIKLTDKLPVRGSFRFALLFMAIAFLLLITNSPTWTGIAIAGALFFTGFNFLEAKMPSMVSSIAPAGSKGSAMGIYASHQFFGAFLGGILSGLLNSYFSAQYTFIMCLVLIFLLSLIAKGLASTQQIKRVTLRLENTDVDESNLLHLSGQIKSMAGVQEVLPSPVDKAIYLKVDAKIFELDKAKALIKAQN
jgi:predicted MFS family arabinose efflux permease